MNTNPLSLAGIFGTKNCSRCGGSGSYSFCTMHGTTCFKCGGTGKSLLQPKFSSDAAAALSSAKEPVAGKVEVGDVIVAYVPDPENPNGKHKGYWKRVAAIEVTPGTPEKWSSRYGLGPVYCYGGYVTFTFTDGTTARHSDNEILRRKATWERALPFCRFEKTRTIISKALAACDAAA